MPWWRAYPSRISSPSVSSRVSRPRVAAAAKLAATIPDYSGKFQELYDSAIARLARLGVEETQLREIFGKIDVNGGQAHPLYRWLTAEAPGLLGSKAIKWNFTKFLVGRDGRVIRRYAPQDAPQKLAGDIEAALG